MERPTSLISDDEKDGGDADDEDLSYDMFQVVFFLLKQIKWVKCDIRCSTGNVGICTYIFSLEFYWLGFDFAV